MLGYIFIDGISILARQWVRMDEYWRFLIIPVAVYFVWIKRADMSSLKIQPNFILGMPLVIIGCCAYLLWKISFVDFFIEFGLFILAFGSIFLFLSARFAKLCLFPLFYLVFMTTILVKILSPLTGVLQHFSAIGASFFLNTFGWSVLQNGNYLRLPHMVLEVAPVCSGTSQLIALIAFALPIGALRHKSFLSRALLTVMAIPITIFSNAIRIAIIAVWNYSGPQTHIHGPGGIMDLPLVYPLALGCIYACSLILTRFEKMSVAISTQQQRNTNNSAAMAPSIRPAWYIGFSLLAMTIAATFYFQAKPELFEYDLIDFPMQINGWSGENQSGSNVSFYMGKPDAMIQRLYRNKDGEKISIAIARFDRQNIRKRLSSIESPFFKGVFKPTEILLDSSTILKANSYTSLLNDQKVITVSWFDMDGVSFGSSLSTKKQTLSNTLRKKRNNGAAIAVSFTGSDELAGEKLETIFIKDVMPSLKNILRIRG
jgi:exosortase